MELEILYKYGVIIPVNSDDKLCDLPRRDKEKEDGITGSPKKRPYLLDKKSILMNTPKSDITPDPKDDNIKPPKEPEEGEFITVTNKKGWCKSSAGALGKIQTDMKFPRTDGNKRQTRNSKRLEGTNVESDLDFHKAESA